MPVAKAFVAGHVAVFTSVLLVLELFRGGQDVAGSSDRDEVYLCSVCVGLAWGLKPEPLFRTCSILLLCKGEGLDI